MPSLSLSRCVEVGFEVADRPAVGGTVGILGLAGDGHEPVCMAPIGHRCCHPCTGLACSAVDDLVHSFDLA